MPGHTIKSPKTLANSRTGYSARPIVCGTPLQQLLMVSL